MIYHNNNDKTYHHIFYQIYLRISHCVGGILCIVSSSSSTHMHRHKHTLKQNKCSNTACRSHTKDSVCQDLCLNGDIQEPSDSSPQKLGNTLNFVLRSKEKGWQVYCLRSSASYVWGSGFGSHTRNPADLTNSTSTHFLTHKLSQWGLTSSDLPLLYTKWFMFVERCEFVFIFSTSCFTFWVERSASFHSIFMKQPGNFCIAYRKLELVTISYLHIHSYKFITIISSFPMITKPVNLTECSWLTWSEK